MHKFKKQFGQNFLRSNRFPGKLVKYLDIEEKDTIIEVGPGEGILTNLLTETKGKIISVEVDYSLLPKLIKKFAERPTFNLVNEDFLQLDLSVILDKYNSGESVKFAGSLPYNISKKIILKILQFNFSQTKYKVKRMAFIVQEEVASDYASKSPKASLLANLTNLYASIKKMESIPKSQFYPVPMVNGGILVLEPKEALSTNIHEIEQLMKIAFVSPRKTLYNNLKSSRKWLDKDIAAIILELGINEKARASEVNLDQWELLYNKLSA